LSGSAGDRRGKQRIRAGAAGREIKENIVFVRTGKKRTEKDKIYGT